MSPVALPGNALATLRGAADRVRQRLQGQSFQDFSRFAELSGQRAIVAPGKSIVIRLLPRWDVADQVIPAPGGKYVANPKYPAENKVLIYVGATCHWFTNPATGKPQRCWCRLMLNDENERCPICEASTALQHGSEDDKKLAKDIRAKESYLFNAIIRGSRGENTYTEKGEPDIRILNTPPTVWVAIIDIMTGGPEAIEAYAKGEIFNPAKGYDLMITRPAQGGTDRYKVACANTESPLYTAAEAPKWKDWAKKLHNLEAEVGPEQIPSFNDMWKLFYGRDPDESEAAPTTDAAPVDSGFNGGEATGEEVTAGLDPSQFGAPVDGAEEASPGEFDGIALPGSEAEAPTPPPPARTATKTPPPPPRQATTRPAATTRRR